MTRQTTHHATKAAARDAQHRQEADPGYPVGATFEVVQTNVGDPATGTVDRFAVEMTW